MAGFNTSFGALERTHPIQAGRMKGEKSLQQRALQKKITIIENHHRQNEEKRIQWIHVVKPQRQKTI
jgi:hypothetical protein